MNADTFWTQVAAYNQTTLPIQVLFLIAGVVLTILVFMKPGKNTDFWMKHILLAHSPGTGWFSF